jgi:hypothetical protein
LLRPAEFRERFKRLAEEYGWIAFVVWFGVFGLTILGAATAIEFGVDWPWLTEHVGTAGTWAAAYVVAKLLGPVRFAVVATILPFIGRWRRRRGVVPPLSGQSEGPAS